jgi:hypothetical protein
VLDGDLDVLPDMGSFESSFSQVSGTKGTSSGVSFDTLSSGTLNEKNQEHDPSSYAKAVRTIIKREEKG